MPLVTYSLLRLGLFALALVGLWLAGMGSWLLVVVAALVAWAAGAGLPLVGVDNTPGSVALEGYALPRACVLLFGQEGTGLSAPAQEECDVVLHIRQFGSTRSINAGAAAAIAMHAWVAQHAPGGG